MKTCDVMPRPCGDCAFVPGTEAHGCESTRLSATLCVEAGEPFYCHRPNSAGVLEARVDETGEPVLCHGFVEALDARGAVAPWRQAIATEGLRILEEAIAGRAITEDAMLDRVIVAGERAHMEHGQ